MTTPFMSVITVGAGYAPLAATRTILTRGDISCPPGNLHPVLFKGPGFADVPWVPTEWHAFRGVDLAQIQVKGTAGETVTVVGYIGVEGGA
jgi:hypothetical protein